MSLDIGTQLWFLDKETWRSLFVRFHTYHPINFGNVKLNFGGTVPDLPKDRNIHILLEDVDFVRKLDAFLYRALLSNLGYKTNPNLLFHKETLLMVDLGLHNGPARFTYSLPNSVLSQVQNLTAHTQFRIEADLAFFSMTQMSLKNQSNMPSKKDTS